VVTVREAVDTREECNRSHACSSFKQAGVGTNGILGHKFQSKNAHRTDYNRAFVMVFFNNVLVELQWRLPSVL
jgi:hypothetical protein